MERRYRRAGEIAGQAAIAAVVLVGLLGSACIIAAFVLTAFLLTS